MKQLLYPAAWLTLTLGINIMAMATVDLFPRNLYMGFGVLGCMVTLIIEAALVAEFVPSDNQSALLAAVAMLFIFQIFYGFCLDGKTPFTSIDLAKESRLTIVLEQVLNSATSTSYSLPTSEQKAFVWGYP